MNFNDYQQAAMRTAHLYFNRSSNLIAGALGITGEAGEVAETIKKYLMHGHSYNADKIAEEVGDTLWYAALLAQTIGISLEDIAERNIEKLRARYPDGFSAERSVTRDV